MIGCGAVLATVVQIWRPKALSPALPLDNSASLFQSGNLLSLVQYFPRGLLVRLFY
jgi:hypothetical protein